MSEVPRRLLRDALQAGMPGDSSGCLDAETLARWADDSLSRKERAAAEAHTAGCARCQAMLAAMARTEPPAVARSWFRWSTIGWMAPLTAAAVLIVWIALPRPAHAPAQTVARTNVAPPPVPEMPAARDEIKRRPDKELDLDAAPLGAKALARKPESAEARREKEPAAGLGKRVRAGLGDAAQRPKAPAPPVAAESAPPAAAGGPPPPSASAGAAAPRTFVAGSMQDAATLSRAERVTVLDARRQTPVLVISSSDSNTRWRVLPDGVVQRSADGGSTWDPQQTGTTIAPTAGASPSPLVCWLVGPQGLVLRSTDGHSWTRIAFPETAHLTAVRAVDEKTAIVTTSDGRTFRTSDGGTKWMSP